MRAERLIGIDFGSNLSSFRARYGRKCEWHEADLSDPSCVSLSELANENVVVVCSDFVEHLGDPRPLIALLTACYRRGAFVLTSTPDRIRVRGKDHKGPPPNPSHVREWALSEYTAFLAEQGLPAIYAGYTINNNKDQELKTIITIHDIRIHNSRRRLGDVRRPLAILAAYNEVDVIEEVTEDLLSQGCDLVVMDNWSGDGTWDFLEDLARRNSSQVSIERFPANGPLQHFEWRDLLSRKEEIAASHPGRWIIHTDADEIRRSPFPDMTLAEAFALAERTGANRVNFNLMNFRPIDDRHFIPGSLKSHFNHFEYGTRPGHFRQGKAWLQGKEKVDLSKSGGHSVEFPQVNDFPFKFVLQHYPIRSHAHGQRKILIDRRPRWSAYERRLGWHIQYDECSEKSVFVWDRSKLQKVDDQFWQTHGLVIMTDIEQRRLAARSNP